MPTDELLDGCRPAADEDADDLVALIATAYDEHDGCVLDLPGVDADLTEPATVAARRGGRWWVVEREGRIVATIGTGPVRADGHLELKRLYVAPQARGAGLATALVHRVERHAAGCGARAVDLWSDTRFTAAHHRYRALGYEATGESRQLDDPSDTTELRFVRAVGAAPKRRGVAWEGPRGHEVCWLVPLPDGALLRGEVREVGYEVEVDDTWRTRRARVTGPDVATDLTSDGSGRWWRTGEPEPSLDGCTDVDIEATPATNTLPIRRLGLQGSDDATITAAWIRVPGPDVEASEQRYTRIDQRRWRYASGTFSAELEVDDDGLVVTYGSVWRRTRER